MNATRKFKLGGGEPLDVPNSLFGGPQPNTVIYAERELARQRADGSPNLSMTVADDDGYLDVRFRMSRELLLRGDNHYRKMDGRLKSAIFEALSRRVNEQVDALFSERPAEVGSKSLTTRENQRRNQEVQRAKQWAKYRATFNTSSTAYLMANTTSSTTSSTDYFILNDPETMYIWRNSGQAWDHDKYGRMLWDKQQGGEPDESDLTEEDILKADRDHARDELLQLLEFGLVEDIELPASYEGNIALQTPAGARHDDLGKVEFGVGRGDYRETVITMPDNCKITIDRDGKWQIDDSKGKKVYRRDPTRQFNKYMNASDLMEEFMADMAKLQFTQSQFLHLPVELFLNWLILRAAAEDGDDPPQGVTEPEQHPAVLSIAEQPKCLLCGQYVSQELADKGLQFCDSEHAVLYMQQQGFK